MPVSPEHVVTALRELGGEAHVGQITAAVTRIAPTPHPKSVRASVRRILQEHCRASNHYRGPELFLNVHGLKAYQGIWTLLDGIGDLAGQGDLLQQPSPPGIAGSDWTQREVEQCVEAYLDMLRLEVLKQPYSKADYNRRVQTATGRSKGSVEFKFQNVSAVLDQLGLRWINGYKPAKNAQTGAIKDAVERLLGDDGALAQRLEPALPQTAKPVLLAPLGSVFTDPPPKSAGRQNKPALAPGSNVKKFDRALADQGNRELGRAGEQFVVEVEKSRLKAHAREDLADQVCWVADEQGDGAGYDIASFDVDGTQRLIEVKTTNGAASTSFLVTTNEVEVSRANPATFWLYRVYDFAKGARIYCEMGPIDAGWDLEPVIYRAHR